MAIEELEEMRKQLLPDANIEERILYSIYSRRIAELKEKESEDKPCQEKK